MPRGSILNMGAALSLLDGPMLRDFHARGLWHSDTVYDVAARHAARAPDRLAARDRFRRLTWRQLVDAADALADDLAMRGVKAGQRVMLWLPDRIETIAILLACSRSGFVSCPSPHRNHTVAEVEAMVEHVRAAAFMYQPGFGGEGIEAAIADLGGVRQVYRLPAVSAADEGAKLFAGLLANGVTAKSDARRSDPDRVSYIAFTSGSTGRPKAVMHSDNTLLVTARALCRDWGIGSDTVVSTLSPFSHNLGVGAMMTALVAGAALVIHDTPRGESIVDRLAETGVDYLVGVPTHAIDLVAEARRRGMSRLADVRVFRVSGAASPPQVMHDLMALGVEPQSGYGMTENNSHQYTRPGDDPGLIAGTCGRACEGYEIAIFDRQDPDRRLGPGETGLVAGRGACLMLGYFDDQRATEAAFNADGWFMTGDLGQVDAGGYLRLTGRHKEVLIRGGHNINLARIEEFAAVFPSIVRAAVLPLPDARLGERICLAYVVRQGEAIEAHALLGHLRALGLSRYELPEYLLAVSELPLMPNGKIDKAFLLRAIAEGSLRPEAV